MSQAYGTSVEIYYNTTRRALCDSAGVPLPSPRNQVFLSGLAKYVLKIHFVVDGGTAAPDIDGTASYWGAVDNNYNRSLPPYVTVTYDLWNITGDWVVSEVEQPSASGAKLCCRLDLSPDALLTALGTTNAYTAFIFEVHGCREEEERSAFMFQIPLRIYNPQQAAPVFEPTATPTPTPTSP